jgi:hypothetical protein
MHMRESTPIGEYSKMYMELAVAAKADMDGCAVVKYYFSLPSTIRELINRCGGD